MSSWRESEFARLEQLLREADERAEQERRRAQDERRNRIAEEKKTRPTTFEEYLRACHTLLSKPLQIQIDKSLSTQGYQPTTEVLVYRGAVMAVVEHSTSRPYDHCRQTNIKELCLIARYPFLLHIL